MRTFDDLRGDVLALFGRLEAVVAGGGHTAPTAARQAAAARGRLADGRLTVVVCGEFKRGKSTLLSALLDEPGLFPADTLPVTNAVTVVRWADTETVTVTLKPETDGGSPREVPITRDGIAGYVTEDGNPGNDRGVLLVTIGTPNPKLASGLVFVDTPGVGGVLDEHTAATLAFLPNADALLFVTDVEKPLLSSELVFLRQALGAARLANTEDSLLCAMTKTDQTTDHSALLADARTRIAALAGRPADRIPVIPVSSWAKLDFLATGDRESLRDSGFESLEPALWAALGRRRVPALLGDALRALADWNQALLTPVEAAERVANDLSGKKLIQLRREARDRHDRLDRLTDDSRFWETAMNQLVKRAADRVTLLAENELERNWTRFHTDYLYDPALLYDLDKLVDRLAADLSAVLGGLLKLIRTEVAAAAQEFSTANGFQVTAPGVSGLPGLPPPGLPDPSSLSGADKHGGGVVTLRNTVAAAGIGGVIGGLLGTLLAPGPGTALGASAGTAIGSSVGAVVIGWFGLRSSVRTMRSREVETQRTHVMRAFAPSRAGQEKHLRGVISLHFQSVRADAITMLKARVEQEKETAENVLRRLAADQRAEQDGRAADQARYAAERAPLDALATEIRQLAAEVATSAPAPGDPAADPASETPNSRPDSGSWAAG